MQAITKNNSCKSITIINNSITIVYYSIIISHYAVIELSFPPCDY